MANRLPASILHVFLHNPCAADAHITENHRWAVIFIKSRGVHPAFYAPLPRRRRVSYGAKRRSMKSTALPYLHHATSAHITENHRPAVIFIKSQGVHLAFYTTTQRPWGASGGIGRRFLRNRCPYPGGMDTPWTAGLKKRRFLKNRRFSIRMR
ncbi:MAG: hypothetical protein ACLRO1_01055 [Agathobaculum sp.]